MIWFNIFLFTAVVFADFLTKSIALSMFQNNPYVINSFLSFHVLMNNGIAYGFMNDWLDCTIYIRMIVLSVFMLMVYYTVIRIKQREMIMGELLVLAGGFANIIDRFYHGSVVDFICLQFKQYYWPVFNIADTAIVCGVILMILMRKTYDVNKNVQ